LAGVYPGYPNDKKQASEAYGDLMKRYPSFPDRDEVRMRKALCDFALRIMELLTKDFTPFSLQTGAFGFLRKFYFG
jgi:hypothetical protein